jgi:hypothetical protein
MKLVHVARLLLVVLLVIVLASVLPYYYWKAFDVSIRAPRVSYSPVANKFLLLRPGFKDVQYVDLQGKKYTREEYEQLLPLANFRQLFSSGTMPDSIRSRKMDAKEINLNNIFLRIEPPYVGVPQIPLYPLFESQSGRVRIEMPREFFRIADRMEFIDASTNKVNDSLSALFTDALRAQGFQFPAQTIAGNPNTKKPFDEGYFVVDAGGGLFHIKMVKGRPFCMNTGKPAGVHVLHMNISEMPLKEFYGVLIDRDNKAYIISYDHYRLIELPVLNYDPSSTMLLFSGDLFFRTFSVVADGWINTVVTDREYKIIDRYTEEWPTRYERTPGRIAAYLYPFTLNWMDENSVFVDFFTRWGDIRCLVGTAVALLVLIFARVVGKKKILSDIPEWFIVLLTGLYGLIAVLLIRRPND